MVDLFQSVDFKSHSGLDLTWKIEMDALSDSDWFTISRMIREYSEPFSEAVGIPTGGVKLGKGVLSKVVVQGDNLYIGISGEADTKGTRFTASGNLITGESKATSSQSGVQLEGWREHY